MTQYVKHRPAARSVFGFLPALILVISPVSAGPCTSLVWNAGQSVDGYVPNQYVTDRYVWSDSGCNQRSTALVRVDSKAGHAKEFRYQLPDGSTRIVGVSGDQKASGFGYIVSHLHNPEVAPGDDSPLGSNIDNTYRTVFAGKYHAIHEFTLKYPRWGADGTQYNVPTTIHWLFATGRDHPLWSVTFDFSGVPPDAVDADTRAPYGEMNFGGEPVGTWQDDLAGVAWGDRYQFNSTSTPFTLNSSWDWSSWNTAAPYNFIWIAAPVDAEMGLAGTRVIDKQDAGGYDNGAGKRVPTSSSPANQCPDNGGYAMPCISDWAYQSANFSFFDANDVLHTNDTTNSKRLAWGADWGSLGQTMVNTVNNNTVSGWPQVSYSAYIVLGRHSDSPTMVVAQQAIAIDNTTLTASVGSVALNGPAGVNRADLMNYNPAGYNPVYGDWEVSADNGKAALNFSVAGGYTLKNPLIKLRDYVGSEIPSITLNGVAMQVGVDFFGTYLIDRKELWLTLRQNVTGNQTLSISN